MLKYTTMVYEGESNHPQFGWEFGKIVLFKSAEYGDVSEAMKEFNQFALPKKPWFAYMRVTENGKIVDEEMFDTSCYEID